MTEQSTHTSSASGKNSAKSTRTSTKSKPSTESGIGTKIRKFLPAYVFPSYRQRASTPNQAGLIGGLKSDFSGLSARILAVNVIAIMILGLGVLYLGESTDSLIAQELESMRTEARLFGGAISEGAVRPVFQIKPIPFRDPSGIKIIRPQMARRMVRGLSRIGNSQIRLFRADGKLLTDSHERNGPGGKVQIEPLDPPRKTVSFENLFAQSATRFLDLIPTQTRLPKMPPAGFDDIFELPDTRAALKGRISTTAWENPKGHIVLTAAAPIQSVKKVMGVVFLTRNGRSLEEKIEAVRVDVFRVFLGALGVTVLLSAYLSGLITRPLQRLARAAEAVRTGKGRSIEIPDMAERHDEIGDLSISLRDMTQALWNRMDSIEAFAADVSHEIKNPLTSVRSAVETAMRVKDDASRLKLMEIVLHDVRRLDRLISDISTASRLDAELSREEMTRIDIGALLDHLADAYKTPLEREIAGKGNGDSFKSLDLKEKEGSLIEITHGGLYPVYVRGNANRLSQVFGNLISNALSFTPEGCPVRIHISQDDAHVHVYVENDGPGIPDGKLETIFDRFYSERPGHENFGNHSGLGLSISRQIIDAHGGRIWAENLKNAVGKTNAVRFNITLNRDKNEQD